MAMQQREQRAETRGEFDLLMMNSLHCAAKMTKPACLLQLRAPQPLSQVRLITLTFGKLWEDISQPSVLFHTLISCRLKALSTNQKDETVSILRLPSRLLLANVALALYLENLPSCALEDVKEQGVKDQIRLTRSLPVTRASHQCDWQYLPVDLCYTQTMGKHKEKQHRSNNIKKKKEKGKRF